MRNIQNIDINLKEIVKSIKNNNYLIPKFQRGFVWKTGDISDLGDSIIRGYPISSLLTMPENGTLKVGSSNLVKDDFSTICNDEDSETKNYILDGQQRITSISKLFLSYDIKNEYYFDLLTILVEEFPNDKILEKQCIKDKFLKSPIGESFCRTFLLGKNNDEQPTRINNRFISGKSIVNDQFSAIMNRFLRSFSKDFTEEYTDKYSNYLGALLGAVGGYSIPATVIASDSELGVVIRVFEKVNSTGKKLTLFDLINAKSFEAKKEDYKGGLSDYLKSQILKQIEKNITFKVGVNKFFSFDQNEQVFEKIDKIIRIFEVTDLLEKDATPNISQSVMLKKDADFWFNTWVQKGNTLLEIISWMNNEGLVDIGQITFLEYASAIFLANNKSFYSKKFKGEIKKYATYLRLTGSSFNKSNLDIVERLRSISTGLTDSHGLNKYEYTSPVGKISLTQDDILNATTSTAIFKAIKNLFYKDKIGGKFTVDIIGHNISNAEIDMDDHHIYPKSKVDNFTTKSKFNSIANIVFIDSNLNRLDIRDKVPSEYFDHLEKQDKGKFNCEQNLIDLDSAKKIISIKDAEIFINARAKKIADLINNYF
jgi:uncharacterized protein with ParB-like and HNH nuclease domain